MARATTEVHHPGEATLRLRPRRPSCGTEPLVADVHLEKASFFQRQGFAVPKGGDAEDRRARCS